MLTAILQLAVFGQGNTAKPAIISKASLTKAKTRVKDFLQDNRVPGAAVAVSVSGNLILAEGFGMADVEQQVPADPRHTLFRIASISKSLTATGMALLMEQGKLHPDSTIHYYVPAFPEKKFRPTVRQVAGHLGGIRHYRGNENFSNIPYRDITSGLDIFRNDTLIHRPGTAYLYSSYGYNLLGAVIESASGLSYLNFMKKNVLDRLGMNSTAPDKQDSIILGRGRYYERDGRPSPAVDNSYKWPGGGYLSTATDLIAFGNSYLTASLIKSSTINELTSTQTLSNGQPTGYGIGWNSGKDNYGRRFFGHSGGAVGGTSILAIYPEEQLVIVILTNMSGVPLHSLPGQMAADLLANNKQGLVR